MTHVKVYTVTVLHPTNFHSGAHQLRVHQSTRDGCIFISGASFGCSRDYYTKNHKDAIRLFMSEHGCSVAGIRAER